MMFNIDISDIEEMIIKSSDGLVTAFMVYNIMSDMKQEMRIRHDRYYQDILFDLGDMYGR